MALIDANCKRVSIEFAFGSRMLPSAAPDITQDASTSHKAIWWRRQKSRLASVPSGIGSPKIPAKPAKNDFGDVRNKSHLLGIAEMAWFPEKAPGSPYHKPAPADDVPVSLSWLTLQIFDEANDAPRL